MMKKAFACTQTVLGTKEAFKTVFLMVRAKCFTLMAPSSMANGILGIRKATEFSLSLMDQATTEIGARVNITAKEHT